MTSPDFWKLLHVLATQPKTAAMVFDIMERGVSGNPHAILADNYEAAVGLLNEFASSTRPLSVRQVENGVRKPGEPKHEQEK